MAVLTDKVLVIGGSSGSLEPLITVVAGLPPRFRAAVLVVMHVPPGHTSRLPEILRDSGPLPAMHPFSEQPLEPGTIYVAPPDFHLIVRDSKVELWRGPKEDRNRPSINVLFRSAAAQLGERVIGTILSGALEDGATGLAWVKDYGGVTIVQGPETAKASSMPIAALQNAGVDYVVKPEAIAPLLIKLVGNGRPSVRKRSG